jgi:hypothetical protein
MHLYRGTRYLEAEMASDVATVFVQNEYRWLLDPRYGRFTVFADGRKVGRADLGQRLEVALPAGKHSLSVALWHWYRSPKFACQLNPGDRVVLYADLDRRGPLVLRFGKGMVAPRRALYLGQDHQ